MSISALRSRGATVARPPARPTARPFWESGYAAVLSLLDAVCITAACVIALAVKFGGEDVSFRATLNAGPQTIPYSLFVAMITPVWVAILAASRAYEAKFLGVGSEEFKRLGNATIRFVALVALVAFASKAQLARGFIAVVVPTGLLLLLLGRYAARKVLHYLRRRRKCIHRVVAVGSPEEIRALTEQIQREPYAGLDVVAVALPDHLDLEMTVGETMLPNLGPARDLVDKLALVGVDTVAVAGTSAMSSHELRQLSWDLEGTGTDLVVAPAITDVTGPRIHIRPVAGLPLLHVEIPTFGGVRKVAKRLIDIAAASSLLMILALPALVIAILIRFENRGPVFFRQVRVGRGSSLFRIWKFRTMRIDALDMVGALKTLNESDGPMFKIANDPRVTRAGALLRKYSVDELPQLLNVLGGSMSLVGPRPPLPCEVDVYDDRAQRRLLVKPGMTGLWQVSGRADLPWEEAVRLDLYYVENWSVALDALILWKTVFAVFRGHGAY